MVIAIIGGGPAGLNAALVLARARHNIWLFDNGRPRNAVTKKMHGFLTREGIEPAKFRQLAHEELKQFPHVKRYRATIVSASRSDNGTFELLTKQGKTIKAQRLLLATGVKERLPEVPDIDKYYGCSLFSCPYCDGYELRDRSLALITEAERAVAFAAAIGQWSSKLHLFINGGGNLSIESAQMLKSMGVRVYQEAIVALIGERGKLRAVKTADGRRVACSGGFVSTYWYHAGKLAQQLGCKLAEHGGIWQDSHGRTSIAGVYVAGDAMSASPAQAMLAAADGVRAAISLNQDLTQSRLNQHAFSTLNRLNE